MKWCFYFQIIAVVALVVSCASAPRQKLSSEQVWHKTNFDLKQVFFIFDKETSTEALLLAKYKIINYLNLLHNDSKKIKFLKKKICYSLQADSTEYRQVVKENFLKKSFIDQDLKSVFHSLIEKSFESNIITEKNKKYIAGQIFNLYLKNVVDRFSFATTIDRENYAKSYAYEVDYIFGFLTKIDKRTNHRVVTRVLVDQNGKHLSSVKLNDIILGVYIDKILIPFKKDFENVIRKEFLKHDEVLLSIKRAGIISKILITKRMTEYHYNEFSHDKENKILTVNIKRFRDMKQCLEIENYVNKYASKETAIVIDLRDNPGGMLELAVCIADIFLDQNKVIYVSKRLEKDIRTPQDVLAKSIAYAGREMVTEAPVFILQNKNSASASEVLAASLKDHKRALIFGDESYGKGVGQSEVERFENHAYFKNNFDIIIFLTNILLTRPHGGTVHKVGLPPDFFIKENPSGKDNVKLADNCWDKKKSSTDRSYKEKLKKAKYRNPDYQYMRLKDFILCERNIKS